MFRILLRTPLKPLPPIFIAEYRVLLGNSIPRILESLLTAIRWSPYWPGRYSAAAKALGKLAKISAFSPIDNTANSTIFIYIVADYTRYVRDAVIEAFKVIKITEAEEGLLRIMEEFSELGRSQAQH